MNLKLISVVASLLVVGCATPDDLRKSKAEVEYNSTQPSRVVASCIADRWENAVNFGALPITVRPTSKGYTVLASNTGVQEAILVSDVVDTPGGSHTLVFLGRYPLGLSRYLQGAQECQR